MGHTEPHESISMNLVVIKHNLPVLASQYIGLKRMSRSLVEF